LVFIAKAVVVFLERVGERKKRGDGVLKIE